MILSAFGRDSGRSLDAVRTASESQQKPPTTSSGGHDARRPPHAAARPPRAEIRLLRAGARLAKAEFEEREGAEEDARAAELQTTKKRLVKELGECDLAIVSHEDEGLPTDELESKKSELEDAIVKVDTELRQMRERADRRAKLAEFNEGVYPRLAISAPRPCFRPKLGHEVPLIQSIA